MKFIKLKLIIASAVLFSLLWSCDYLDYNEDTFFTPDYVFDHYGQTKAFLSNIYSYLPAGFNSIDGAMRSSATDDALHVWDLSDIQKMNNGIWSPTQAIDNQWGNYYRGIRAVNIFLENAKKENFDDIKYNDNYPELMQQFDLYPYEARFLRAFFYFELIKRYGDVPLITSVLEQEESNQVSRDSFEDVVQFIVDECDEVSENLPTSYAGMPGSETGRITKGAALALKSRTLLYAASPLNSPADDQTKWIEAAAAAADVVDMGIYGLEGEYKNVVNNFNSNELILERRQSEDNWFERANFPIGYEGGRTGTCPTQNLVDSYEMQETGLSIDEAGSGYDADNPYAGRDPRMYQTILYNGASFKGEEIEVWKDGRNGPPKSRATKTGYYLRKYVIENISVDPVNPTSQIHTWVLFRAGEILLNYAEAMNEAYGPNTTGPAPLDEWTATDAVNIIRDRAGMPAFPSGMSKEDFREKVRNERRVELAFEDHRFWDIRRWKIGNTTTNIRGVTVSKNGSDISFSEKQVETRVWKDKMYLYPIAQNELYLIDNLSQNPDW
jgi:starch-binding outer membrane protein, SusD/RagB family